jgi:hypothetical protein
VAPWTTATQLSVIIGNDGSVSAYGFNNLSDARTKENISAMTYGLKEVMQIRPHFYYYKGIAKRRMGFVAQEVAEIIPEVVDTLQSSGEKMMSVRYADMTSILVKAVQEQQKMIEELKNKNDIQIQNINQLKEEISQLKAAVFSSSSK